MDNEQQILVWRNRYNYPLHCPSCDSSILHEVWRTSAKNPAGYVVVRYDCNSLLHGSSRLISMRSDKCKFIRDLSLSIATKQEQLANAFTGELDFEV